jgi:hypothetical protein
MQILFIAVQCGLIIIDELGRFFVLLIRSAEQREEDRQADDLEHAIIIHVDCPHQPSALTFMGCTRITDEKKLLSSVVNHFWILVSPNSMPRIMMKKSDTAARIADRPYAMNTHHHGNILIPFDLSCRVGAAQAALEEEEEEE